MQESVSTQVTIGATEVRNNFSALLKRVHKGKEHLVVEKGGIPVAALISIREYEAFRRWLSQEVGKSLGAAMQKQADDMKLDETDLLRSLKEDRSAIYQDLYGE